MFQFPDSFIAKDFKCSRTKVTATPKVIIAQDTLWHIIEGVRTPNTLVLKNK